MLIDNVAQKSQLLEKPAHGDVYTNAGFQPKSREKRELHVQNYLPTCGHGLS